MVMLGLQWIYAELKYARLVGSPSNSDADAIGRLYGWKHKNIFTSAIAAIYIVSIHWQFIMNGPTTSNLINLCLFFVALTFDAFGERYATRLAEQHGILLHELNSNTISARWFDFKNTANDAARV